MNLTINVSDELYRRAAEVAAVEKVSVEDLFASAFEERVLQARHGWATSRGFTGTIRPTRSITSLFCAAFFRS